MGILPYATKGLLVILATIPEFVLSGCVFGPDNTDQLVNRNNTIMGSMNDTLFNYTVAAGKAIKNNFWDFDLWNYLKTNYNMTVDNYLQFVSMGKLLPVNWSTVSGHNANETKLFVSTINTSFITPLHEKLQDLAVYYSFSLGIFRPKQIQFHFTGKIANSTSTGSSSLDLSCMAGSQFLWRLSTNLFYAVAVDDTRTTQFATVATMVEKAFEEYYRRNTSTLNKEFVRANFISLYGVNSRSVMFVEIYFLNNSLKANDITSLTKVTELPVMIFNNGTDTPKPVVLSKDSSYTKVQNSTYPITSSVSGTVPKTGALSTTSNSSTNPSPRSTTPRTETESRDETLLSSYSAGTFSFSTLLGYSTLPVPETTSLTDSFLSNSTSTILYSAVLTTLVNTSNQDLLLSSNTGIVQVNTSEVSQIDSGMNSTTTSPVSLPSLTDSYTSNASPIMMGLSNTSSSSQAIQLSEVPANLTTATVNGSLLSNTPSTLVIPNNLTGSTRTVVNQTSNGTGSINGRTTFDPDPFFKANVPVFTKVYNDEYLLRMKIGTMAPLTEKVAFFTITLPAAIGIIAVAILCMLFWQA